MSYLFVVPTIMARPALEIANVENIAKQFPESRILFVSNIEDKDFESYTPTMGNIHKYVSGKKYSIARALNLGLSRLTEDYFVFVQSDVTLNRELIELFKQVALDFKNTGVIGIQPHTTFTRFNKQLDYADAVLHRVLWTDGIMFIPRTVVEQVGFFNEEYLGDRESQEYCYRVHDKGWSNILVSNPKKGNWKHNSVPFSNKVKDNAHELITVKNKSTELFLREWSAWEDQQKELFN